MTEPALTEPADSDAERPSPPVIGISAYSAEASWGVWTTEAVLLPRSYVDAVVRAGGLPVLLPPLPDVIAGMLPRLDGLILAGGPDVEPSRYGQAAGPNTQPPRPERDAAEVALFEQAMTDDLPVLGICRGMQVINVARGGTLHQHLPDVLGDASHAPAPAVYSSHPVRVAEGTRTAAVLGRTDVDCVPSYHHQAIDALGRGLVGTAWAPDGLLEALEDPSASFCVAVQWHPEEGADPALFEGLVAAAQARAALRSSVAV